MMRDVSLLLSFVTISGLLTVAEGRTYIEAFQEIQDQVVWPCPQSPRDSIASAFGPREKITSGVISDDFHRGLDIMGSLGDEIVAVYGGRVEKIHTYSGGGLTVILRHWFTEGVKDVYLLPDKEPTDRWYTMNMHLDGIAMHPTENRELEQYDTIEAGQLIGYMGQSGTASNVHLHHELRIATRCSLEWALANPPPASTCNLHNFDPMINPMLCYKHLTDSQYQKADVSQKQELSPQPDGDYVIAMHDNQPNFNSILFEQIDADGNLVQSHLLDLNRRYGYDASSEASHNMYEKTKPYLNSNSFGLSATHWDINFIIPCIWVPSKNVGDMFRITIHSIWETEETKNEFLVGNSADSWGV
uniref:M23ase beta-sheet core domain-containing protein n=1 Tax=Helicotheca tamesis TaxID=374047 RepID=A0A7S2MHB6_9STRA|mmetsp:Transcript_16083/g.22072  ORF Transcript_16083/g.22072 Transcript_16083/m.22072 type:complete len:359 (+) Transcript_16083:70-1146(+)